MSGFFFAKADNQTQNREVEMSEAKDKIVLPTTSTTTYPGTTWQKVTAAEQGFDATKLEAIKNLMQQYKANGVLVRNGYLIDSWNYAGQPDTQFDIQSCTKTITSLALGLALAEGRIAAIDRPVKEYWPDFDAGPYTEKITFEHLISMTAGIKQEIDYGTNQGKNIPENYIEPGKSYNYLNDQTKLLGAALTYIYGQDLLEITQERLKAINCTLGWDTIARWDPVVKLADGTLKQPKCAYARASFSAENLARIGHLYLQRGTWADKQIITPQYVDKSLSLISRFEPTPEALAGETPTILGYGYSWRHHEADGTKYWAMNGYGSIESYRQYSSFQNLFSKRAAFLLKLRESMQVPDMLRE